MASHQSSTEYFTEALLVTHGYNPAVVSSEERLEAERYLMELRNSAEGLNLSFHIISNEPVNEIRCFWAFNTVIHHLPVLATTVDGVQAEELYKSLFSFIYRYLFAVPSPTVPTDYLINKHAQMMVVGLQEFFPTQWPNIFTDLFDFVQRGSAQATAADTTVLYFLRVFEYIDERVVRVRDRSDRDRQQRQRDMQVKDAMRETVIPRVIHSWYAILCDCRLRAPELANVCLTTLQTYIEWVDVGLLMTADWINLLYFLLTVPQLRVAACACLHSLIEKKQLPGTKMASLTTLNVVDSLPRIVAMLEIPAQSEDSALFNEAAAKVVVAVAEQFLALVDTCGPLLQQQQRHGGAPMTVALTEGGDGTVVQDRPFDVTPQLITSLTGALHSAVAQVLRLLRSDQYEVLDTLLPFIQCYIKSAALTESEAEELLHRLLYCTRIAKLGGGGGASGNHHSHQSHHHSSAASGACGNGDGTDHDHEERAWDDIVVDQRRTLHNLVRLLHRRNPALVMQHVYTLVRVVTLGISAAVMTGNTSSSATTAATDSGAPGTLANDRTTLSVVVSAMGSDARCDEDALAAEVARPDFVEAVLRYFYEIGEAVKLDALRHVEDAFTQMFLHLLTCDAMVSLPCSYVHLTYFEMVDRYCVFFIYHPEFIPVILQRFLLLPCGVVNPHARVRARVCYLFGHLLQVLRSCLAAYAPDMVRALYSIVSSTPLLLPSDLRELYEAIGTLLGIIVTASSGEDVSGAAESKELALVQETILSSVDTLQRCSESSGAAAAVGGGGGGSSDLLVGSCVSYISALVKGVSGSVGVGSGGGGGGAGGSATPTMGSSFGESLQSPVTGAAAISPAARRVIALLLGMTERVMGVLQTWRGSSAVRDRGAHFFHQIINTLPFDVLGGFYENYVMESLSCMDAVPELSRLLRLMTQAVNKAGVRGGDSVVRLTVLVWEKMMEVGELSESAPVVSMGVVSEHSRETLDVYRQFFAYIFNTANWGCAVALLQIPQTHWQSILRQLCFAVTLPTDLDLPKAAIQTMAKVLTECENDGDLPSPHALQQQGEVGTAASNYILLRNSALSEFVPVLMRTMLQPQFDLKDAKNFLLVGEFGQLCKTAVSQFGEDAMQAIYTVLSQYVDADTAREYCIAVRDQPKFTTAMKIQLKQLLERGQQQQRQQ